MLVAVKPCFVFFSFASGEGQSHPANSPVCLSSVSQVMTEILFGIRVIKFFSWESHFAQKVAERRREELSHLRAIKYLDALCVYTWAALPVVISIITFVTYVLLGNQLTAPKVGVLIAGAGLLTQIPADLDERVVGCLVGGASLGDDARACPQVFTTLALVGMLIVPLNSFPWVLNSILEAKVSLERIQRFFRLTNRDLQAYYAHGRPVVLRSPPALVVVCEDTRVCWSPRASCRRPALHPAGPGLLLLAEARSGPRWSRWAESAAAHPQPARRQGSSRPSRTF